MGTQESLTQEIKCDLDCKAPVVTFRGGWLANRELGEGGADSTDKELCAKAGQKKYRISTRNGVSETEWYKERQYHLMAGKMAQ